MPRLALPGCLLLAAMSFVTAGCDDDGDGTGAAGDVQVTAGALAYVAASYAGTPDSGTVEPFDWFEAFADDAVAVDLTYDRAGNPQGDGLTVTLGVLDKPDLLDCEASVGLHTQFCEETPDGTLRWNLYDPEEDPGGVFVLVPKSDGRTAMVTFNGPHIERDPRTVDLPVPVDTVFDIANDPRIDVTTSQEVVDGGAELGFLDAG